VRVVELEAGSDLQAGHRPPEGLLAFDQEGLGSLSQIVPELGGDCLVDEGLLDGDAGLAVLESLAEGLVADSGQGAALVLANFSYQRISRLSIGLPVKRAPRTVRSLEKGPLEFTLEPAPANVAADGYRSVVRCAVELGWNDVVLFE
jgi:hypothetical protein